MKKCLPLVFLTSLLALNSFAASEPGARPDMIHLSWQHDPSTTMTIAWRTSNEVSESRVEYGENQKDLVGLVGQTQKLPEDRGLLHFVEITGLKEGKSYYYRVGGGGFCSEFLAFRTVPSATNADASIRFIVMGDSRAPEGPGAAEEWRTVSAAASVEEPDFIVFLGDAARTGGVQAAWEDWFQKAGDLFARRPVMTVWGDHEKYCKDRKDPLIKQELPCERAYTDNFLLPTNPVTNNEDFYEFSAGPVWFFMLDTEHAGTYPAQGNWMEKLLAQKRDGIAWKIALQHSPTYSSGIEHGSNGDAQEYFREIFDRHHFDLNIGGHEHFYERSKPMINGKVVNAPKKGTTYIVSGGAGAPTSAFRSPLKTYTEKYSYYKHYIVFEAKRNELKATVKSVNPEMILDEFTITK
jgi:acid phosphatase type 7